MEISKDLEASNGLKASENKGFVFLTKENVEESFERIMKKAPVVLKTVGKNYLLIANSIKLLTQDGKAIDPKGTIIKIIGRKYLIVAHDSVYKIRDVDGTTLEDEISLLDYSGSEVALLQNGDYDIVVTPKTIITVPTNQLNVIASLEDGTFFTKNDIGNIYMAYDAWGNFLGSSNDLTKLESKYFNPLSVNRKRETNSDVYQNYVIQNFQKHANLANYKAHNLLDMLNKAVSLNKDFYINLNDGEVYQTTFKHLLKISNDRHSIWIPDTKEEVKVMEDFCLRRRKEHE